MRNHNIIHMLVLMLLAGSVGAGGLLTIDHKETADDNARGTWCGQCFTTGRAQENLLNLERDKPYSLPKATKADGIIDTVTIFAIRVDFAFEEPDDPLTTGRGQFDLRDTATFLAEEGYALDPAPHNRHYFEAHLRALAQYWRVVSNGKLELVYEVWPQEPDSAFHLNKSISHYGAQAPNYGLGEFFHDALDAAREGIGDSISFRDANGRRKAVMIYHAGADRQTDLYFSATPTPNDLFTGFATFEGNNRWFLDPDTTVIGNDTTYIGRDTVREGTIMPETMSQDNRVTCMNAVMAHEFGHQLGLIDLYSTGTSPFLTQMGDFALMDNMGMNTAAYIGEYGVGAFGTVPVFPMAWSRAYLGFENVVEYRQGTSIELAAVKMLTANTKIVKIPISSTEYYLLENRRADLDGPVGLRQDSTSNVILWPARYDPVGDSIVALREYDIYLPQAASGIAVWHIDESVAATDYFPFDGFDNNFDANTLQWDPKRKFVGLVEADGLIDFGGIYHRGFGSKVDLFYAGNNTSFGTYTNPASVNNDGAYTHINVTNISQPGMVMTFDLGREMMAENFPRRIAIPNNPSLLSAIAADLDGDGNDEILSVSGRRVLAMTTDGKSYIDPNGIWNADPKNMDTIYSTIQSTTDAFSRRPIDTSYAVMPVFADVSGMITAPLTVATFNDTTVVIVGTSGGMVYTYLPYDSAGYLANDGRANVLALRVTPLAGPVRALIADQAHNIVYTVHSGARIVATPWDASGPVSTLDYDLAGEVIGWCRLANGFALAVETDDEAILYTARTDRAPDSIFTDSIVIGETGFHSPIATDFDRDGREEIALVSGTGQIRVFSLTETGLIPYENLDGMATADTAAAGPVVGDITGDGYPELIVPGTNYLYAYTRLGFMSTDFPLAIDYSRPGQLIITPPIISDINGDNMPDMVVTTLDSTLYDKSIGAFYIMYPDTANYPDSFIVVDTTLDYDYYNYSSAAYVVSPGMRRIEGFPVSSGILGFRQPGDTVMGAGSALHVKRGTDGLLVTTGADGWLNAWECGWSDNAALWPMAGRDLNDRGYLSLAALGEEIADAEFLPEDKFFNYPNPVTGDKTMIRFYVNQSATVTISIIDALGDEIWSTEHTVTDGNAVTELPWELDDVASGVYHCRIEAVAASGGVSKVAFKTIAVVK